MAQGKKTIIDGLFQSISRFQNFQWVWVARKNSHTVLNQFQIPFEEDVSNSFIFCKTLTVVKKVKGRRPSYKST